MCVTFSFCFWCLWAKAAPACVHGEKTSWRFFSSSSLQSMMSLISSHNQIWQKTGLIFYLSMQWNTRPTCFVFFLVICLTWSLGGQESLFQIHTMWTFWGSGAFFKVRHQWRYPESVLVLSCYQHTFQRLCAGTLNNSHLKINPPLLRLNNQRLLWFITGYNTFTEL